MDVLGLATSYMQQSGYHRLLWKLMVMPLLPANHLVPTFRALDDRARGKSDAIDALLTIRRHDVAAEQRLDQGLSVRLRTADPYK